LRFIETNALIPTKFCTAITTTNVLRGWSKHAHNRFKIANGLHFEKLKNRHISAMV